MGPASERKEATDTQSELGIPREVQARIRAHMGTMTGADERIARVLLDQPKVVIYRSVAEVGEMAETSSATVVRCAQKMGFKGFHDLKIALANELAIFEEERAATPSTDAEDPRLATLTQITKAGAESVRDAAALVDPEEFEAAVDALAEARRVLFLGVGTSAPLCQDAAYRFSAIGIAAEAPSDAHVQHVKAKLLTPDDVCLLVSHTGSTRDTLTGAEAAAEAGATMVAITSFATSPLSELADHVIVAGTRELALRLEAMASRLAHLALLDALLVAVAERDERRSQAALAAYTDVLGAHRM